MSLEEGERELSPSEIASRMKEYMEVYAGKPRKYRTYLKSLGIYVLVVEWYELVHAGSRLCAVERKKYIAGRRPLAYGSVYWGFKAVWLADLPHIKREYEGYRLIVLELEDRKTLERCFLTAAAHPKYTGLTASSLMHTLNVLGFRVKKTHTWKTAVRELRRIYDLLFS